MTITTNHNLATEYTVITFPFFFFLELVETFCFCFVCFFCLDFYVAITNSLTYTLRS